MGMSNIRQMFNSFSAPQMGYQPLKYYCMSCGNEHRETSCPKCGSKMIRVG
jgi:Zn finger protein HypA/HybF involved in hydrogenase expression